MPEAVSALEATLAHAPVGIAHFSVDGTFILVNQRICDILGFAHDDLLKRRFQEITFPDDLDRCLDLTGQLARGELHEYQVEKRFVRPDGGTVWTRITVSCVRTAAGTPDYFIGIAEDISAHVAAHAAKAEAERRLREGLRAAHVAAFRFDVRENRLLWADGLAPLFGNIECETLQEFFQTMHPDDAPRVMDAYTASVSQGIDFEIDFRVVWPDGSVHWLHDRGVVVPGEDGRPLYIDGALTDVTNHKRMEEVIVAANAQFQTLANSIPQMAWIADSEGRRSWYNQRWLDYTGCTTQEMLGLGWLNVHPPERAAGVLARQLSAFAAGTIWEETTSLRRHDGTYRWFLTRALPVRSPDGTITQWFGTNTDITDERESRLQAERAAALRDQVLAFVAHDVRNPVQTIIGAAGSSIEYDLPEATKRQQLEIIRRSAWHIEHLICDLLDMSRIEAGTFAVRRGEVDVQTLCRDVADLFSSQAAARRIDLSIVRDADVMLIEGDQDRLLQVLSNLIGNALKFTPELGRIELRVSRAADSCRFSVTDSGCGIEPEHTAKVFEKFWQVDRAGKGAGLGLVIVKGIVDAHGGSITVESSPGAGSAFHVLIPGHVAAPIVDHAPLRSLQSQ